ncbi:MAG: alpha/beta hydrolase [Verrucomicrobiota bacterium]
MNIRRKSRGNAVLISNCIFVFCIRIWATEEPVSVAKFEDVRFAEVDGHELRLDLLVPRTEKRPRLLVFVHGGGWKEGSRKASGFRWLVDHGYAVASISYRLTDIASHPAQIHDCKGAVRWLRAHADRYAYDASEIVIGGTSAGGHLATLLGVTHGVKALEGDVGGNLEFSSGVSGIIDFYGGMDFIQRSGTQPEKTEEPEGIVYRLLGGPVLENKRLARQASPAYHVDRKDPPLLVIHGDKDNQVLIRQSERIVERYRRKKLEVRFVVVEGGERGGEAFKTPEIRAAVLEHIRSVHD